ncbi:tyrosine-type recombinase/integrase [Demequina aurantiaca]|uniref:tyrosine-type recombinase/integrase n=1 Tax=Demequina aurantiaca TaxID=676200 RepID=UPI003D32B43D
MADKKKMPRGIDIQPNGLFRARVFYNGKQHMVGAFFTLGDAKAAIAIARSEMARKIFVPPSELRKSRQSEEVRELIEETTVAEWSTEWLRRLEDLNRTPATLRSYESTLHAHIVPAIGAKRLIDVTPDDIDALLATLTGKPGAWTNVARTMRSMFLAAVSAGAGGLTETPFHIPIASTRKGAKRILGRADVATPAQVRDLANAMPPDLRVAVLLAAWCAMRLGEVLGLQRGDFADLDNPDLTTVHISRQWNAKATPAAYTDPKAGSDRVVAIPPDLVPVIVRHLAARVAPELDAPLLPRRSNPRLPVSQSGLDAAWRKAREGTLPGFRFHSLRHTGLTEYAKTGATLAEIQSRGGHTSADVAMRYQHASLERDRASVARLPVLIGDDNEGN